jgi:UDP-N-acetyl-D-mannosaminuronic acid dehydrogenase
MLDRYKKISVIGLGYIGLPTAALLASKGYIVNGMDVNENAVETINKGEIHIVEPDLDAYVRSAVANKKLKAYREVQPGDVYIICVPTPFHYNAETPTPNVDYIRAAADSIAPHINDQDIVILESTSPVGTTDMIREVLNERGVNTSELYIAYCPERVLPGKIMTELVDNARVIGGIDSKSTEVVASFYETFVNGEILRTEAKTAEMCKLTENSFRDVNIAFANELSVICDRNGVNVWDLIQLANHHPRVNVLQPGTGVGGHCIAVDPWFIVSEDPKNSRLIKTARVVNDDKPDWVINKIKAKADLQKTRKIVCLGLAFKPDIDDLRESPAIKVVDSLLDQGYEVFCVEPNINDHNKYRLIDLQEAISQNDVIALLVKHKEFTLESVMSELKEKHVLDFCGMTWNK